MKKIAAAALAATMTLSVAAVPAEAASNKMTKVQGRNACQMTFDKPSDLQNLTNGLKDPVKVQKLLNGDNVDSALDFNDTSSKVGEAFGSSDQTSINDANNIAALRACADLKNYQSQPMTEGKRIGIILGVVFTALGLAASAAAPFVQQFLPF